MPLFTSEAEKRQYLANLGYDPDKFDVLVDGQPVTFPVTQSQGTASEAALGFAKRSAIPSLIGGAAALGVGTLLPPTAPLAIAIGAPLLTGMGVGGLAAKGQEEVLKKVEGEQAYNEGVTRLARQREEHPYASLAGELAPQLLFARPGLPTGLAKLPLAGQVLSNAEKAEIGMAALNAGIGAGMEAYNGGDAGRVVGAGVAGGLLNKPWLLGAKITGYSPETAQRVNVEDAEALQSAKDREIYRQMMTGDTKTAQKLDAKEAEASLANQKEADKIRQKMTEGGLLTADEVNQLRKYHEQGEKLFLKEQEAKAEKEAELRAKFMTATEANAAEAARIAKEANDRLAAEEAQRKLSQETLRQQLEEQQNAAAREAEAFKKNLNAEHRRVGGELLTAKEVKKASTEDVLPEVKLDMQKPAVDKAVTEAKVKDAQTQLENVLATSKPAELYSTSLGLPSELSPRQLEAAARHGVNLVRLKELIKTPENLDAAGRALTGARSVEISKRFGGADTLDHETFHLFLRDRVEHGTDVERQTILHALKKLDGGVTKLDYADPAYQRAEELLATKFGKDQAAFAESPRLKQWWDTFKASVKKTVSEPSFDDLHTILKYKYENDPTYQERFAGKGNRDAELYSTSLGGGVVKKDHEGRMVMPILRSEIEHINTIPTPEAQVVAKAFNDFYENYGFNKGRYEHSLTEKLISDMPFKDKVTLGENKDLQRILQRAYEIKDNGSSAITLTPQQKKLLGHIRETYSRIADDSADAGLRKILKDPEYISMMTSKEAIDAIRNDPQRAKELEADFKTYQTRRATRDLGLDPAAAEKLASENWDNLVGGLRKKEPNLAMQYGPLDKAEGLGIPPSMRETNLAKILSRYTDRASRRLAWEKTLNTPSFKEAMKNPTTATNEQVNRVLADIAGIKPQAEVQREAAVGVIKSFILGPVSSLKDMATGQFLGLQHMTLDQLIPATIHGITNLQRNTARAIETGAAQPHAGNIEFNPSTEGNRFVDNMTALRNAVNILSGRSKLEQINRTVAYGTGDFLARANAQSMLKGTANRQQTDFLRAFMPEWKGGAAPSEELFAKAAARYVGSVQGNYDYRGLPSVAVEGSLAPFLSLSRWSIEKTNNFMKYVVNPAAQGNWTPAINSTIGMFLGGAAAKAVAAMIYQRKQQDPTWAELSSVEGHIPVKSLFYKLASLADVSGYAGIMGSLAHMGMAKLNHVTPSEINNPLTDTISKLTGHAGDLYDVIKEGNAGQLPDVLLQMTTEYSQVARIAINNWAKMNPESMAGKRLENSERFRDLKTFKNLYDLPVGDPVTGINRYANSDVKAFKLTDNLQDAVKTLNESILPRIMAESDPETRMKELQGLKQNSYQTFPSMENQPLTASRYYSYLNRAYGPAKAEERLSDYLRQNALNQAKSSLIPSTR